MAEYKAWVRANRQATARPPDRRGRPRPRGLSPWPHGGGAALGRWRGAGGGLGIRGGARAGRPPPLPRTAKIAAVALCVSPDASPLSRVSVRGPRAESEPGAVRREGVSRGGGRVRSCLRRRSRGGRAAGGVGVMEVGGRGFPAGGVLGAAERGTAPELGGRGRGLASAGPGALPGVRVSQQSVWGSARFSGAGAPCGRGSRGCRPGLGAVPWLHGLASRGRLGRLRDPVA